MALDVLSKRGRQAVEESRLGLALVGRPYVETAQEREGDIDGFFLSQNGTTLAAAFEAKARDMTLDQLRNGYGNEWLVTYEKIAKGAAISRSLCVPLFGVVYLIPDQTTLLVKLTDDHGNIVAPVRLAVTETRANCNGGKAIRTNAYVSMENAYLYRRAA
jgi:hypothetical protein